MIILIGQTNQPKNVDITTVTLAPDVTDSFGATKMYMFHCSKCGSRVAQYAGNIVRIFPGLTPTLLPVLAPCTNHGCRARYYFKDIVSLA